MILFSNRLLRVLEWLFFILTLYNLYCLIFSISTPILLDSNDNLDVNSNIQNLDYIEENTVKDNRFNSKSWLYWRMFVKHSDNYVPYNEFKDQWLNNKLSFKQGFHTEISKFKSNPYRYLENHAYNKKLRVEMKKRPVEIHFNGNPIKKIGIPSNAELNALKRKAYIIKINKD